MGYESKLVVVMKWRFEDSDTFGETVAELNLAGMPNTFFPIKETFENECDKAIYMGDYGEVTEDKYGEKLRYTTPEKLLKVLYIYNLFNLFGIVFNEVVFAFGNKVFEFHSFSFFSIYL